MFGSTEIIVIAVVICVLELQQFQSLHVLLDKQNLSLKKDSKEGKEETNNKDNNTKDKD